MPHQRRLSIKVHRVTSLEEIRTLEDLAVDYIGFDVDDDAYFLIDDDPFWGDERYLTEEHIAELLPHLELARGFVEPARDALSPEMCQRLAAQGVGLLQVNGWSNLDPQIASACGELGLDLIYDHLYIEPEDEPMFYNRLRPDRPCLAFFDLQLFPSYKDAWSFLTEVSPKHPQDLVTLEDINALATKSPLFVSLNATQANIGEIIQTVGSLAVAGLSFTLSQSKIGSFHTFGFQELVTLLKTIHQL